MLRKVRLKASRTTQPKLRVAGNNSLPVVTWNTSGIDRIATRRMRVTHGGGALFWVNVGLCVLVLLALLAMAVLLVSYPPF